MDKAHEWTEEQINELTQKFKDVYAEAQIISTERLGEYLNQFDKLDLEMRKKVSQGEITQKDYYEWRKKKMLRQQQLSGTLKDMAIAYNNADVLAMQYLNNSLPMILGVNFDYGASEIFGMKWSFRLYDQKTIARLIAADPQLLPLPSVNTYTNLDWYQKKLNSAITQGILHGDSIPQIAKQLDSVTQSGMAAAIRNTRTAVTGAECAGRDESYRMAQEDGVELVREWMATLDNRTRHSHAAIDGEQREVGEAFSNGCMYPGDPSGAPSEVYNCRCTIVGRVKGYEKYHQRGKYGNGKLGDETYDEWKARHIAALEEEKAKKSGGGLKNGEKSDIIKSNKANEIDETLTSIGFARIDKSFYENIDERQQIIIADQLKKLDSDFKAIQNSISPKLSATLKNDVIGSVSRAIDNPANQNLSFSSTGLKNLDSHVLTIQNKVKNFDLMPCEMNSQTFARYVVTHEYGHMVENSMIANEMKLNTYIDFNTQAAQYKKEILDIANSLNHNFDIEKSLSKYGKKNDREFFAECFANSQLGKPNDLGKAMQIWLEEGF